MVPIILFVIGAAILIYAAEKLVSSLVGVARGLTVSVFLLAIIFTGIEFDDVILGIVLNLEDMSEVAVGIVFGTAVSILGIVLALMAIISPSKVNIPKDYLLLFALAPVVLIPFILTAPLTIVHGIILMALFVAFICYVVFRESKASRPVFRDAEMYDAYEEARAAGTSTGGTAVLERPDTTTGGGSGSASGSSAGGATGGTDQAENVPTRGRLFGNKDALPFPEANKFSGWAALLFAVLALAGVIVGAYMVGEGTEGIMEEFEIEATVFGATLATLVLTLEDIWLSVRPALRGAPEIGLANVIGSAIFSVTGKLGVILLFGGVVIDSTVLTWHLPALIVMTWISAFFISTGHLRRWHGFVLLGLYIVYWVVTFFVFGLVPVETD